MSEWLYIDAETVAVWGIVWWRFNSTRWTISTAGRQRLLSRSLRDDVTSWHTDCFRIWWSAQLDSRDFSCHGHCVMSLQLQPLVLSGMKIRIAGYQRLLSSGSLCDDVTTPHTGCFRTCRSAKVDVRDCCQGHCVMTLQVHTLVVLGLHDQHRWTLETLAVTVTVWWRYNFTHWFFQGWKSAQLDIRDCCRQEHCVMMLQLHTHWLFQGMTITTGGH